MEQEEKAQGGSTQGASVFLKRIKEGYTWSIFVSAPEVSEPGLLEAVRLCRVADGELREVFPTPVLDGPRKPGQSRR